MIYIRGCSKNGSSFSEPAIDDMVANLIIAQLLFLESEDPSKEIYLYINSPGGIITSGLAIYDTMQYVKAPIVTTCIGQAASMGAVLLAGGEKGKTVCPSPFTDTHSSAPRRGPGTGERYRYSGKRDFENARRDQQDT